ncbi:MAG: ribbon-helix-helix domain-containing protein [Candidatus Omnitrophota bacterium]|jgi:hypothetical protein
MIRVNIHLSKETIEELDKIAEKASYGNYWRRYSRADLVRYAIGKVYGINAGYNGFLEENLKKFCSVKIKNK